MNARALMALALLGALAVGEWAACGMCSAGTIPSSRLRVSPISHRTAVTIAPGVEFDPDPVSALRADQARSIERVLLELDARFDEWRERGEILADSLLSWRTRGSLAWRTVRGFFGAGSDRRRELVRERFESMVMADGELEGALRRAAERLALELRADRSRALARVRQRIEWRCAGAEDDSSEFASIMGANAEEPLERELLRQADRSLAGGVAALIGATVVTEVVAMSVGTAAGGAAAGAAGGSVVPGAGTAIGFAAGLGAGIAVDWWMHARTRDEIVHRCGDAIDRLRAVVVDGDGTPARPGLRKVFKEIAEREAESFQAELAAARSRGGA